MINIELAEQKFRGPRRVLHMYDSQRSLLTSILVAIEFLQAVEVMDLLCCNLGPAGFAVICLDVVN